MKNLLFFLLMFVSTSIIAQHDSLTHTMKELGLKLTLPNNKWYLEHARKHKGPSIYHFKRKDVKSSYGTVVIPEVMVVGEIITPGIDLTTYSLAKQKPYSKLKDYYVEKVFTDSDGMLKLPYAVGNKAHYIDENDGTRHTFYFIHAVKGNKGIQIIIDIKADIFKKYEEEITSIIRSLEYK